MNVYIIATIIGWLSVSSALPNSVKLKSITVDSTQAKRDLSLSYAATDIGSKEGTHVKTITVIKNIVGKKDKPLKIDAKLHKSEHWGSDFRDNFNSYGSIPDVPDIDDLFEFVNKKEDKKDKGNDNSKKQPEKKDEESKNNDEETEQEDTTEKSVTPSSTEEASKESNEDKVEKINGDAELIQSGIKPGKVKSQSLDLGKYKVQETTVDEHFPNGQRSGKYIQSASTPYFYPDPTRHVSNGFNGLTAGINNIIQSATGRGSISVTTPSGRKFDIPLANATDINPYIAPNARKNQNHSIQQLPTSSQRPYIAPNLRKTYEVQLNTSSSTINCGPNTTTTYQQPAFNVYQNFPTNTRTNGFSTNRPNLSRSRGLRY